MEFPDIRLIKERRRVLGLTQKQLANLSNVSQSLIAKLEAGKIEPSYSLVCRIFDSIGKISKRKDKKCMDLMTKKVISINPKDKVSRARDLMRKGKLSQLPVIQNGKSIGRISESVILDLFDKDLEKILIEEVMEESFPVIDSNTPIRPIIELVKDSQAIVVVDKGKISGIITKSDLI